jgi:hypothetical protein
MSVGGALKAAARDFYEQSWRLVLLNATLSAWVLALVAVLDAYGWPPPALAVLALAGPPALALMHCAVTLARTEELRLADAARGLRLHWRRGLALAALLLAVSVLGGVALLFWASTGGFGWVAAVVVLYILGMCALYQLPLWQLAAASPREPFGAVLRAAAVELFRRPVETMLLALALLLVNVAGAVAAVLPLLTLTVAYSFLAAAHFALPPDPIAEA